MKLSIDFNGWILIFGAIVTTSLGQLLMKGAVRGLPALTFGWSCMAEVWPRLLLNPYLYSGLAVYGLSTALWLAVLSRMDVSIAQPLLSMGYILTAFMAYFIYHEPVTMQRLFGVLVILIGVVLVTRS